MEKRNSATIDMLIVILMMLALSRISVLKLICIYRKQKLKKVRGWHTANTLYDGCYTGSWRDANIHLWASDKSKAYYFSISCPIALGIPYESVVQSQSADVEFGYDKHFYFSYFYLLNYGPKILEEVQKYLMQDVDDPMDEMRIDGKRMTRAQAYKIIDQREKRN